MVMVDRTRMSRDNHHYRNQHRGTVLPTGIFINQKSMIWYISKHVGIKSLFGIYKIFNIFLV